jgi:hypothetical protein
VLPVDRVGANATNDLVDIEPIRGNVENGLVGNANNKDPIIAGHKRHSVKIGAELPEQCFFDAECAIEKATGNTVFDCNSGHGFRRDSSNKNRRV